MAASNSYYEELDVSETASAEEIKKQYRKKVLTVHPDKISDAGDDVKKMKNEQFQKTG